MDRQSEELQYLGAFGIVAESFKVLRSCLKLLGLITPTLVLPLSFVILAHNLLTQPLFHKIAMELSNSNAAVERTVHQIYRERAELVFIELSYVAFVLAFSLLSTSAVVYTVACLYTGRELSYATVISVVPRVWKRLMKTFLWFFAIMFVYYVAVFVVLFLWVLITALCFFINGANKINLRVMWFGIVVFGIVFFCVHVYISMVWQLASVVSVVEDNYGLRAMKKSRELIKGKRVAALALYMTYLGWVAAISGLFKSRVVHGGRHKIGVGERCVDGVVLVVVQCAMDVMWLLTQSVLYFVCKSYHHQRIDKPALSEHLEGYVGEYMPLKSAVQLENLDP